jgi:hypothetical protein
MWGKWAEKLKFHVTEGMNVNRYIFSAYVRPG